MPLTDRNCTSQNHYFVESTALALWLDWKTSGMVDGHTQDVLFQYCTDVPYGILLSRRSPLVNDPDFMQDWLLLLFKRLKKFDPNKGKLWQYINYVARRDLCTVLLNHNKNLDKYKDLIRLDELENPEEFRAEFGPALRSKDPESSMIGEIDAQALMGKILNQVPPEDRVLTKQVLNAAMSYDTGSEIAKSFGMKTREVEDILLKVRQICEEGLT